MAEAYNKEHPNVHVTTQLTTWSEYWTKLEASATGGSAPDIITMNVLHVEEYADAGILLDLTDAEKESDLKVNENFPAPLVDGYTVDGKLYGIPKDFDTNAVFYNKEIFDKAGVEYPSDNMTFEDFKAKCEELKNAGLPEGTYPTAVNRNSGQTTYDASVFANGGYFLSEGNENQDGMIRRQSKQFSPGLILYQKDFHRHLTRWRTQIRMLCSKADSLQCTYPVTI